MTNRVLLGLVLVFILSCNNDDSNDIPIKQQDGSVWLSAGLAVCAEQIHLGNGDTLIVNLEDIISFRTGDSVNVTYKEIGLNVSCTPGIECEIIEIKNVQ